MPTLWTRLRFESARDRSGVSISHAGLSVGNTEWQSDASIDGSIVGGVSHEGVGIDEVGGECGGVQECKEARRVGECVDGD
mmetsp:Transcript_27608/g.42519  ORF Transcript_27608/g.42519 Transcript_27608/m.42519 type:complete len:81 (+) Transcript_27608:202-444(+)